MHEHFYELDKLYKKLLGRPIDLDGYNTYKQLPLYQVENILSTACESKLASERIRNVSDVHDHAKNIAKNTQTYSNKTVRFHVVIVRLNENTDWIHKLATMNCDIYLYERGSKTSGYADNVIVIPDKNIGFEDYAYVKHMIHFHAWYKENPNIRIIFTQCGLDHNPHILSALANIDSFVNFHSLYESIGSSIAWGGEKDNTNAYRLLKRNMYDIGGGMSYIDALKDFLQIEDNNIYANFCKYLHIKEMDVPLFSPCATFSIKGSMIANVNISTFHIISEQIHYTYIHSNPIISKVLASVYERMWFTLFRVLV